MSATRPTDRSVIRRLLGYFRPYISWLCLAIVLMALQAAVPGALVFLVQRVLDDVLIRQDHTLLAAIPIAVVALYALNGSLTVGRGLLTKAIAWHVVTQLRRELFAQYLHLDVAWHQRHPIGQRIARLTHDVQNIQYGVSGIVTAIQKPLTLLVLIASAFWLNPRLAIIAVLVLPLIAWPIDRFGRRLRATVGESLDNLADLTASSTETMTGIRVVQAFGGEADRLARFDTENERQRALQLRAAAALLMPGPAVELIAAFGVGIVIWVGGQQVFAGEIAPGALIAFMVALGLLNDPLKGIAQIQTLTQRAVAGGATVFEILDRKSAVDDADGVDIDAPDASLSFEGVGFDYGDGPVLQNVDFRIGAGTITALVGASGSGKSTIATLIPRFYDVTSGHIRIDDRDIREITLTSLRSHMAIVSQETFLFNDTIRANIAFGSDPTEEDIVAAAQAANAHDFISALPKGYDTTIDELGLRLSGGERQRLCIARAVLRDAPVLILDEATSALDAESEAVVQEALDRLARNRTVLAIAHRLSTIRSADQIIVLDQGCIVERGTHAELMARAGTYARLVHRQDTSISAPAALS